VWITASRKLAVKDAGLRTLLPAQALTPQKERHP
jgi:hypothetical protein